MKYVKYVLLFLMTWFSLYPSLAALRIDGIREIWKKNKPYKSRRFWVAMILCVATILFTVLDERNAELKEIALNAKIESQIKLLEEQEKISLEQTRIIGSISFNIVTSYEGKLRFVNCFRNLARLAKFNVDGTHFEGLICKDGVAIYWFNASTEEMTGFYFFTNSELNKILAGLPDDASLIGENGNFQVHKNSVLEIALRESIFRKTPIRGASSLESEIAYSCIENELNTLLRYVYRAHSVSFADVYKDNWTPTGAKALTFKYYVNPYATESHLRTVSDFIVTAEFIDSLYDIDMAAFSQKVISHLRRAGIEPKLRIKDIYVLNRQIQTSTDNENFPFGIQEKGGLQ